MEIAVEEKPACVFPSIIGRPKTDGSQVLCSPAKISQLDPVGSKENVMQGSGDRKHYVGFWAAVTSSFDDPPGTKMTVF